MSVSSLTYLGYNVRASVASLVHQSFPKHPKLRKRKSAIFPEKEALNNIPAQGNHCHLTVGNFREHVRHFIPEPTYRLVYAFDLTRNMSR